jgi:hypothetical protein
VKKKSLKLSAAAFMHLHRICLCPTQTKCRDRWTVTAWHFLGKEALATAAAAAAAVAINSQCEAAGVALQSQRLLLVFTIGRCF